MLKPYTFKYNKYFIEKSIKIHVFILHVYLLFLAISLAAL